METPEIFNLADTADFRKYEKLAEGNVSVIDSFNDQVEELLSIPNITRYFRPDDVDLLSSKGNKNKLGRWVYYPWRKTLVHILAQEQYDFVRLSRNKYILNAEEQDKFRKLRIGFAGLSVGSTIAVNIVLEGGAKYVKLADVDRLSLSNMNRMRYVVSDIGITKVECTARELFEIDPYIRIDTFDKGLDNISIDKFLSDPRLDYVVEETDDLEIKARLRKAAKKNRIDLIMGTSLDDRILIDYEAYSKEDCTPFLGKLTDSEIESLSSSIVKKKKEGAVKIVGTENLNDRILFSLREIGNSINSFPQVSSGTVIRAGMISQLLRYVLEGRKIPSGRYILDLKNIFNREL